MACRGLKVGDGIKKFEKHCCRSTWPKRIYQS